MSRALPQAVHQQGPDDAQGRHMDVHLAHRLDALGFELAIRGRIAELAGLVLLTAREVPDRRLRARALDLLHALSPETLPAEELERLRGRDVEQEPLLTEMEGQALVVWAKHWRELGTFDAADFALPLKIAERIAARRPHSSKEGGA